MRLRTAVEVEDREGGGRIGEGERRCGLEPGGSFRCAWRVLVHYSGHVC